MRALAALLVLLMTPLRTWCQDLAPTAESPPAQRLIAPKTPQDLQDLFRDTGEPLPLVSAHRGGAGDGLPENCLATFEKTLRHTYAILEIDPRYTKEGEIVVHHDATLDRTTTGTGPLNERTLQELKALRLKDPSGAVTENSLPTLDEVLEWARGKTILILDQKDVSVEARVRKIEEHHAESYAMLIVYSFEDAKTCYRLNPDIMLEVMIPSREKFRAFERSGIPWSNIVAFVGHMPPKDRGLLEMLHAKGVTCIAGTSRNLDRTFKSRHNSEPAALERDYRHLLHFGVNVFETDLPREVGTMLYGTAAIPESKQRFFK